MSFGPPQGYQQPPQGGYQQPPPGGYQQPPQGGYQQPPQGQYGPAYQPMPPKVERKGTVRPVHLTEALLIGMIGMALSTGFLNLNVFRFAIVSTSVPCAAFAIVMLLIGFIAILMLVMPAIEKKLGNLSGMLTLVFALIMIIWGLAATFGGSFFGIWGQSPGLAVAGGFLGLFAGLLRMGIMK
jgi:hypothetical protein